MTTTRPQNERIRSGSFARAMRGVGDNLRGTLQFTRRRFTQRRDQPDWESLTEAMTWADE